MNTTALIRPAWTPATIALMVIGFMVFWPLGFAMLAYIIWGDRLGRLQAGRQPRHRRRLRRLPPRAAGSRWGMRSAAPATSPSTTGARRNSSASPTSAASSTRCCEEFDDYARELRRAKDQEEFDRFMANRSKSTPAPKGRGKPAASCSTRSETRQIERTKRRRLKAAPFSCVRICAGSHFLRDFRCRIEHFPEMPFDFFRRRETVRRPPVEEREHSVAGRTLPLRIVENDRARRLTLRIDAGGRGLSITVPPGIKHGEVDRFLFRHQGWLEQRLAKVPEQPLVRPGIKIPIRGVPHRIVHEPGTRGTVKISHDAGVPVLIVHGDRRHLPRRVADFLKREAKTRNRGSGREALRRRPASAPRRSAFATRRAAGVRAPPTARCRSPGAS